MGTVLAILFHKEDIGIGKGRHSSWAIGKDNIFYHWHINSYSSAVVSDITSIM